MTCSNETVSIKPFSFADDTFLLHKSRMTLKYTAEKDLILKYPAQKDFRKTKQLLGNKLLTNNIQGVLQALEQNFPDGSSPNSKHFC